MNSNDEDQVFLRAVKDKLDQQQDAIDDSTRNALSRIRHQAITQASAKPIRFWSRYALYPALALTASIAVVISIMPSIHINGTANELPTLDDMALLTASDDIMLYQELEFYQWLDAEKING